MDHLDSIQKMLEKHCSCVRVKNKILLETISICPECESLFSTDIYDVPQDRLKQVLDRLTQVMAEFGIESRGAREMGFGSVRRTDEEGGFTGE